jgi:shikimate dehydrogenase
LYKRQAQALLASTGLPGEVRPLSGTAPPADLLINATSLGMTGQPPLDVAIGGTPLVFDCVYAPLETPLLASARAQGCATIDGLAMLIGQAAAAFRLFYGADPPRQHDAALRDILIRPAAARSP